MRRRTLLLLACLGMVQTIFTPVPASSAPLGVETTTDIQVWQINLHNLKGDWRIFVDRLVLAPVQADIIIVQELCDCDYEDADTEIDLDQFDEYLNGPDGFGAGSYAHVHGDAAGLPSGTDESTQAVFWRTSRFSKAPVPPGAPGENPLRWRVIIEPDLEETPGAAPCSKAQQMNIAVKLVDAAQAGKRVVAASVQFPPNRLDENGDLIVKMTRECLAQNLATLETKMNLVASVRNMTLVGGDFNKRPERNPPQNITQGLEADPDCWYLQFSAAHANAAKPGCSTSGQDHYYDTVWLHPAIGGGTNPTAPSFCEQFTHKDDFGLMSIEVTDATNSCTDVDGNTVLDKGRVDYLWVGWENPAGVTLHPPLPLATSYVHTAGADTWLDLESLSAYSDHRGVQALLSYPTGLEPN